VREENRAKVLENRMLKRIFGPKKEEGVGGRRSLHYWKLNNLCASPNVVSVSKSRRTNG
jgi:hypothetical protein